MRDRLRGPANAASGTQAAAAAGLIIGRRNIASVMDVSVRTVTRRLAAGVLPIGRIGPAKNNALIARRADIEKGR